MKSTFRLIDTGRPLGYPGIKMKRDFTFMFKMTRPWARTFLAIALGLALGGRVQAASPDEAEDLRKTVEALRTEIARLAAAGKDGGEGRLLELERRIDLLATEIEKARTGGATDVEAPAQGEPGLGPAASKVYRKPHGVSIGGYGEALYQNFSKETQDGSPSGLTDRLDLLRIVLYTGYKFSDRILFNSEVEYEHATTGAGADERGEVSVEQAYLDFRPWHRVGIRAGMVLVPLGFVNELHEPPIFLGARRPDVERAIVPSTWREVGAGLFGETGPFQWRGYVVAGLDSAGFSASGIRGGRQQGSESAAEDLAFTGRVDYVGARGLLVGGALFTGGAGQGARVDDRTIGGRTTIVDLHAQYERRGLFLRALYARTSVADAALINARNGLSGNRSVGSRQYGYYVEAGYDLMTRWPHGTWAVLPFLRYERFDTQDEVPAGFSRNAARDRKIWTAGVSLKPLTRVAVKADYQWTTDEGRTGVDQLNLAVGFLF
jgi:hypothetical protein